MKKRHIFLILLGTAFLTENRSSLCATGDEESPYAGTFIDYRELNQYRLNLEEAVKNNETDPEKLKELSDFYYSLAGKEVHGITTGELHAIITQIRSWVHELKQKAPLDTPFYGIPYMEMGEDNHIRLIHGAPAKSTQSVSTQTDGESSSGASSPAPNISSSNPGMPPPPPPLPSASYKGNPNLPSPPRDSSPGRASPQDTNDRSQLLDEIRKGKQLKKPGENSSNNASESSSSRGSSPANSPQDAMQEALRKRLSSINMSHQDNNNDDNDSEWGD